MAWTPIALTLPQYETADGIPYSGAVLKPYEVGTSTPIPWATDSTGAVQVDSIALNANGYPEVSGAEVIPHIDQDYKIVLYPNQAAADADSGALWSIDGLLIGQVTAQFIDSGATPTFATPDSFTLNGNQTADFHPGRRVRTVDGGGTDYGTITASSFLVDTTTVTVSIDGSGVLDAGLSQVALSILTAADDGAIPGATVSGLDWTHQGAVGVEGTLTLAQGADVAAAATLALGAGNLFNVTGAGSISAIASKGVATVVTLHFVDPVTLAHNPVNLILPGAADINTQAGDVAVLYEYAPGDWRCQSYTRASGRPIKGGWELISTTDFAGAAEFDVPVTAEFSQYHVVLEMVRPSVTANELQATVSDGTFQTAGYWYGIIEQTAGTIVGLSAASTGAVRLTDSQISSGVGDEFFADIWITGHAQADRQCQIRSQIGHNGGGTIYQWMATGRYGTNAAIEAVRLAFASGNFAAGRAYVYGLSA